ncbi:hypothetical protein ACWD5Q_35135 [Streptomyces sp. NPDC002513]
MTFVPNLVAEKVEDFIEREPSFTTLVSVQPSPFAKFGSVSEITHVWEDKIRYMPKFSADERDEDCVLFINKRPRR